MKRILLVAAVALVLPGAARGAACSPLNCAPSQFTLAHGTLLGFRHAADRPVTIVDLATGKARYALPDGITAGNVLVHQDGLTLEWWDMTTGTRTETATLPEVGQLAGVSQDGSRAVTILNRTLRVVSPASQVAITLPKGQWQFDALLGDRLYLIEYLQTGGYRVRLLTVSTGALAAKPLKDPHESAVIWGSPFSRLSSPDGRYLFTLYIAANGAAMVHELDLKTATARCIDLPGSGDYLSATSWALALRGRTLWAASPGYARVIGIDIRTRKVVRAFALRLAWWNRGNGTRATLSPDGTRLALADGETVAVVGLARRAVLSRTTRRAVALGYSPAGRLWALT